MKKIIGLIVLFGLTFNSVSHAACWRDEDVSTIKLNMDLGRVVISPNVQVGEVFYTKVLTTTGTGGIVYRCSSNQNVTFTGTLNNPGENLGNGVFATNIPGVGMRLSRGGATVNFTYPGKYETKGDKWTLEGSNFTVELIKTAPVTGSGNIAAGLYSTYRGSNGSPLLETYVTGNGITIISPSCNLLSGKIMNITLPSVKVTDFSGIGSTAGSENFDIQLQCQGGVTGSGFANINMSFSGNIPGTLTANQGVLNNESADSSKAKGVGIQVIRDGRPIDFDGKYHIIKLNDNDKQFISVPLTAKYYQYEDDISSGKVESHMVFNIDYD